VMSEETASKSESRYSREDSQIYPSPSRERMEKEPPRERSPARRRSRSSERSRENNEKGSPRRGRSSSREREQNRSSDTLYISGLSSRTRQSDLEARISKYGKIITCNLITDPRTGESRGFGFIRMETEQQATEAQFAVNRTELDGRIVTVEKVSLFLLSILFCC